MVENTGIDTTQDDDLLDEALDRTSGGRLPSSGGSLSGS